MTESEQATARIAAAAAAAQKSIVALTASQEAARQEAAALVSRVRGNFTPTEWAQAHWAEALYDDGLQWWPSTMSRFIDWDQYYRDVASCDRRYFIAHNSDGTVTVLVRRHPRE